VSKLDARCDHGQRPDTEIEMRCIIAREDKEQESMAQEIIWHSILEAYRNVLYLVG